MEYTAVIRTLGRAGEKYQTLLDSLKSQTLPPSDIIVYIAEGYPVPEETIGRERYVYVQKGMVAQRALPYSEVRTEWILFLDDDVYLPSDAVEVMFLNLAANQSDIISPDVFNNANRPLKFKILMALSGKMKSHREDGWAYRVMRTTGFSYNRKPERDACWAQTNAGACFFCRKETFLSLHFEDESWLDTLPYALGEDQIMFYKAYLMGYKQLTLFNSGIIHLDAGTSMVSSEREQRLIYSDLWFRRIFWDRFIQKPETSKPMRTYNILCIAYLVTFSLLSSLLKFRFDILKIKLSALEDARQFLQSDTYRNLPPIVNKISR